MLIIGIDPGITGAICFFEDGEVKDIIEMPNMADGKKNKRQIALTKNNDLGFLKKFNLPKIKETSKKNKNWTFLCNYKNSISNKKLHINLYYKFTSKIPSEYNWYSLNKNNEFIPSFTKKIFKKISHLY